MTRAILGANRAAMLAAVIAMQEAELSEKFRPVKTCNVEPEPAAPRADRRRKEKAARKQRQKQGKHK